MNGTVCLDSSQKVDPAADVIAVDGQIVGYEEHIYLMLYKPAGVVSATEDNVSPTVIGLLPRQYQGAGLFPVGRLDKDTTGLLLITNDGTWAHGITSPKKHMDKIYDAVVEGDIPPDMGQRFADGIVMTMACTACRPRPSRPAHSPLRSSSRKESSIRSSACVLPSA